MPDKLKVCRCCLKQTKTESELYEFSSEVSMDSEEQKNPENFVKIAECYRQLTGTDVPVDSEDITKICSACLGDLKFCFIFQKKCWDNDKMYNVDEDFQQEQNIIEYVEEEYVDGHDEDTNDEMETVEDYVKSEIMSPRSKSISFVHPGEGKNVQVSFPCELCPKVFNRRDYYRRHYRSTHLSDAIEETADRYTEDGKFAEISQLQLHQCEFCGKISVSKEEHEAHETEHINENRYKCKKCDAKFTSKDEARSHLKTAHSNDEKSLSCETCSKTFKNRYQLVIHNRSHTGEKPFECPVCNRCFSMSSNLQKHLDTHNSEKPFQCKLCNSSFKTQRSLKFHTVCYHQPEDKVKCPQCDKSFVNKSYLKMHMLYHTGEKNYTCNLCHGKYYKTSHLKRHVQNVHFKLRLMKCEFCTSDFVRKETYKAHIISQHKRHISASEFEDVLDRIKKFQPPSLNINDYILEKQDLSNQVIEEDVEGAVEVIEEEREMGEEMEIQNEDSEYYEESDLYEDEQ